jgi:hypothetical protein
LWRLGIRSVFSLLLTALAPVSLMISGFHVNTDPLVVCAVLSAAWLIRSQRFAWAGAALGAALSIKLTALLFVPALAIAVGARRSLAIVAVALACFYGLSLPFIWEFPKTIAESVLAYAPISNTWGINGLSLLLGADGVHLWYARPGKFVALGMVAAAMAVIGWRGRRQDLLGNCGLSAALFLVFTPGFGVQYLVYLVPWLVVVRSRIGVAFHAISGAFMVAFYTWGSNGFPWFRAIYFAPRLMPPGIYFLALLTWIAIGIAAVGFGCRSMGGTDDQRFLSMIRNAPAEPILR